MRSDLILCMAFFGLLRLLVFPPSIAVAQSLREQNEILFEQIQRAHGLSDAQMQSIRRIFSNSGYIGQGNPAITEHPMTPQT